ncbi:PIR protein [Plasmodium yoelii]|uniref:YIR protein n=1 Tax=Plasmodium yoelii TaxID=5861 RepID=A0A077Y6W6_PLAYE|nr:PIR protein [Plasmodium yoelii]CDU17372.1 YIR protein [Plasmodium yoelii]VTZ77020.1 PIR protein [Plasmodium yoelii]|eukprot:XP_022811874.1 PIR protein [Plasmodium yoelii]
MNDDLCGKFGVLRMYLPDELGKTGTLSFDENNNFIQYCPENGSGRNECKNNLDNITAGFLWLLEQCYSAIVSKTYNEDNSNAFFLHMLSWFSYKLNQNSEPKSTKIYDFYTKNVINSNKYNRFKKDAYTISGLEEFINKKKDLLDISIEDMSKFYDVFKLLCNIHGSVAKNNYDSTLSNNANDFVKKYNYLNNNYNIEGTIDSKILSALSTDYNNIKNKCDNAKPINFSSLPEITTDISALASIGISSSSSIGNKLFTVLSIFGAIAFFLGISYKYSLFGFRKRAQKQHLREKIKKIKKKMNH